MKNFLLLFLLLTNLAFALPQKGIAVIVDDVNLKKTLELIDKTGLTLYLQFSNEKNADAARESVFKKKILGKRVFINCDKNSMISLADNLADVVFVNENDGKYPDALRVVRPGGTVIYKNKTIIKPVPEGIDEWSHPYHSPGNNPLSSDKKAVAPFMTQFIANPKTTPVDAVTVASGGKLFKIFGNKSWHKIHNPMLNTLICLNNYNGTELWRRKISEGFMIHRNTMIATPENLLLADDESCKIIDAETGEILKEIVAQTNICDGKTWKWMAKDNGILYALIGGKEHKETIKSEHDDYGGWPWGVWKGYDFNNPEKNYMFGRTLCAFNIKTGKLLWYKKENDYIDGRAICMNQSYIFYYVFGKKMVAVNKTSGKNIWAKSDKKTLEAIGDDYMAQAAAQGFATYTYLKCNDKYLVFSGPQRPYLLTMSTGNGDILWKRKNGNYHVILNDNILYALGPKRSFIEIHWKKNGDGYKRLEFTDQKLIDKMRKEESEGLILAKDRTAMSLKLDCKTGKILGKYPPRAQCTRATASTESIFYRVWEGTAVFNIDNENLTHIAPMRPPCQDGIIIADGMLHWGTWTCHCNLSLYGNINLANAKINIENGLVFQSKKLNVKQKNVKKTVVKNYASTINKIPGKSLTKKWTADLSYLPLTPAVVAEGIAFCGDEAGVLHAVDTVTGKELWQAFTAAAIFAAPAYWSGRVFVASADGNVYAYDAADGRLLWKYQLAPAKRFINVYGKIMSTWPLSGGLVVKDGIVYSAAGIANYDGTYVCALNAESGKEKWVNKSSGTLSEKCGNGVSLQGFLYIKNNELCFEGGNIYPVTRYDLSTGKCLNKVHNRVGSPRGNKATVFSAYYPEYNPYISFEYNFAKDLSLKYNGLIEGRMRRTGFGLYDVKNKKNPKTKWRLNYGIRAAITDNDNIIVVKDDSETSAVTLIRIQDGKIIWKDLLPGYISKYGITATDKKEVILSLQNGELICYK